MRINDVVRLGLFSMCSFVFALQLAQADVVTDWNERAVSAGYTARITPSESARNIAMVHLAMFEALNSIEPRYTPYRMRLTTESSASREAAGASAAHYLMVRLYPDQAKEMDKALAGIARCCGRRPSQDGRYAARRTSGARHARRTSQRDGATPPNTYRPFTVAGQVRSHRTFRQHRTGARCAPSRLRARVSSSLSPLTRSPVHSGQRITPKSKKWARRPARRALRSKPRSHAFGN